MTTTEFTDLCGLKQLTGGGASKEIKGAFAGDLLSWAMSRVNEGDVWFTVMGNINTVAVASLSDCACIVLCHGAALSGDARERAEREGIIILATELPIYEAVTEYNKVSGIA